MRNKNNLSSYSNSSRCTFWQKLVLLIVPRLLWLVTTGLYLTCRKRFFLENRDFSFQCLGDVIQAGSFEHLQGNAFIFIFWHGEFLFMPFAYSYLRKTPNVAVVASRHFHGEIVARLCRLFGYETIRGSSNHGGVNRGGMSVVRECLNRLSDGFDVALTPDGPKGPYHSVSDGVVALNKKTHSPLIALRVSMSASIQLNSWDRFKIPIPFSRIDYYISAPFHLPEFLTLHQCKQKIYKKLQALC